jgi:predicted DNA-binding protein
VKLYRVEGISMILSVPTERPRITITLDEETSKQLELLSEETGLSKSHLTLTALQDMLQENPNELKLSLPAETAQRLANLARENFRSPEDEARLAIAKHLREHSVSS